MPIASGSNVADPARGVAKDDPRIGQLAEKVRRGFEEHLHLYYDKLKLLSSSEAQAQRQYVEDAIAKGDREKLEKLLEDYASSDAQRRLQENREVYGRFFSRLESARKDNVISDQSYEEWAAWIRNDERSSGEKTTSMRRYFDQYLREREELAKDREVILKNPRLKDAERIADPKRREMVLALKDDKLYFETLSFSQRRNLVDAIQAFLPVLKGGERYKELYAEAEKVLLDATKTPQPALHRDKVGTWLKRIFGSGATYEQMEAFVTGKGPQEGHSLPQLIGIWRAIAVQFWITRKDPAFEGIKTAFIDTKAFLWKHYDETTGAGVSRVEYLAMMRARRDRAKVLRRQARSRIDIPEASKDAWIAEHLFNGTHTLEDLESIINGDLASHLKPLQDYMEGKDEGAKGTEETEGKRSESEQINELIGGIESPALQKLCITFCEMGSEFIGAARWTSYNREWCNRHGYLDPEREYEAIRTGKEQALTKRRRTKRRGVVSEAIDGETAEVEYIQLSRTAPTNVCIDLADAGSVAAFRESMRRHCDDARVLYWTNAIFHVGGSLMPRDRQNTVTKRMFAMRNLLRKMEKNGQRYRYRGAVSPEAVAV